VRTLIVSDLHLGTHTATDVLQHPAPLAALLEALDGVDRIVLLGDLIELRSGPVRRALAAARPVLEALGQALDGRQIVIVPGNHDHALIAPWLERRAQPLSSEERVAPHESSPAAAALAGLFGPGAQVVFAYPGVWVRPDVYATHGHYLDCHMTLPTLERIAIGAMARFSATGPDHLRRPEDYEALVAPVYAWIHAVAQTGARAGAVSGDGSVRAWRALASSGDGRPRLRARALAAGFPLAIAALNRAGLGPLSSDLSSAHMRRGRLAALACALEALSIDAGHVIFGHTHRTGPLPDDDGAEWRTPAGAALLNCGSWIFETHLMTRVAGESPYWPGGAVTVDDDAHAPRLARLLGGCSAGDLRSAQIDPVSLGGGG
jgi:predicted phosphodiesterase